MSIDDKLLAFAQNELNVLLIGKHGVGKTLRIKRIAEQLNLKLKYYSSSTLDPWADLVGVPVPNKEENSLNFYRPKDLEEAEFVLFDELNRAHPRVLNAVLEIIQFKTINGSPLKNLKMVWAAINPPGEDYDVEDIDPALMDRFHVYLNVKPEFNMEYMKTKMSENVARVLRSWWMEDMDKKQRNLVSPRRLEYMGMLIDSGLDWADALPKGALLPEGHLRTRLKGMFLGEEGIMPVSKENILDNPDVFIDRVKQDPAEAIKIKEVIAKSKFEMHEYFKCRNLLESLPKDLVVSFARPSGSTLFPALKKELKSLFFNNKIDPTLYPKIWDAFDLNNDE